MLLILFYCCDSTVRNQHIKNIKWFIKHYLCILDFCDFFIFFREMYH